jgi:rhodanese-related sulfurtransferase
MKLFATALVAAAIVIPQKALTCEEHGAQAKKPAIQKMTVEELAALKKDAKTSPVVLDANGEKTRAEQGVIPGAKLLTSAARYDVAKELPASKGDKLVFYCASERCSSAKQAAERAVTAGHTDVAILPVGIQGWKAAGQPTQVPSQS